MLNRAVHSKGFLTEDKSRNFLFISGHLRNKMFVALEKMKLNLTG